MPPAACIPRVLALQVIPLRLSLGLPRHVVPTLVQQVGSCLEQRVHDALPGYQSLRLLLANQLGVCVVQVHAGLEPILRAAHLLSAVE